MPKTPRNSSLVRWENGTAHVRGVDPYLHYALPQVVAVAGIRIRYSHANKLGSPARFRVAWRSAEGVAPTSSQYYSNWALPTGRDQVTTVWIAEKVKDFWIQPDNQRCEFTVNEITLLTR